MASSLMMRLFRRPALSCAASSSSSPSLLLRPSASSSCAVASRSLLLASTAYRPPTARAMSSTAVEGATPSGVVDEPIASREMHEVISRKDRIRMSPWKINLLARQIRGLPVVEALMQLKFSRKQKGPPLVAKVIQNAANLANIRHNLLPEDLMVAEAFTNRANIQKGIMIMGRGRFGLKLRRYSHVVVRLKEIDFDEALKGCKNRFQKQRWEARRKMAEEVRVARGASGGAGGGEQATA